MTLQIGKVLELEDVDNGLDDYRSTSNLTFDQYRYYLFKEVRKDCKAEFLALKHESRILGQSFYPVCGFSRMGQVRLCAVWPMDN